MKKNATIILPGLLSPMAITGQDETSHRYVALGARIYINSNWNFSLVTRSKRITCDGCIPIPDAHGNLLFYMDWSPIYNLNYIAGVHGKGWDGPSSGKPSAQVGPIPKNTSHYNVFTVYSCVSEEWPGTGPDRTCQGRNDTAQPAFLLSPVYQFKPVRNEGQGS